MSWKRELQLRDIASNQRIEATCRTCGHTHYVNAAVLMNQPELQFVYMDELEEMTICKARRCSGTVRISLVHEGETEGFVGGAGVVEFLMESAVLPKIARFHTR